MSTIMIVDDSLTVRKFLEIGLQREDRKVVCCDNSTLAWETLREQARQAPEDLPNSIILDILMPKLDG